ncbi:neuronal acetylcholine receptor subunit beta-3-like [Saccostrea echinata]|uniref:neuronal acetylcholine receptor subunit beta-3-like n=1 Tax=Saccostrea echinata TaxID=191078 RepID=UPI002A82FE57|nr:neuronal acetylcholine receptor subunit beta-3-like [Saccostrea echinata]
MDNTQKRARDLLDILVFLFSLISGSQTYNLNNELDLHAAIFNSTYDRNVRPGFNRDIPLQIDCGFILKSVKELDESLGKFSVTGALGLYWTDDRLIWNPQHYGGNLDSIIVPQKKIWVPFLMNMHDYGEVKYTGHEELSLRINSSGSVSWSIPNLYESTCHFDFSNYPFDSQTCTLPFYVTLYRPPEVLFFISNKTANMLIYSPNGLWNVTKTQIYTTTNALGFQEVRVSVSLKRRSAYYISSLILPIFSLSFLQLFVFLMPPESGERVGFSVTVLLAVAVYLTLIQDKLPEASEPSVAYLSYKLLVDFIIGIFIVVGVIMGLRFYHREEEKPISKFFQMFHRIMLSNACWSSQFRRKVTDAKIVSVEDDTVKKVFAEDVTVNTTINALTWKDIGMAMDRFCLILTGLSMTTCNFVYFLVIAL